MAHLSREQILARKTGAGTATLPDGSTVAIRALTRDEVVRGQEKPEHERDIYYVWRGLVEPRLSYEEVKAWAESAPAGDLVAVAEAIAELSGLMQGAGKGAYKRPRK